MHDSLRDWRMFVHVCTVFIHIVDLNCFMLHTFICHVVVHVLHAMLMH